MKKQRARTALVVTTRTKGFEFWMIEALEQMGKKGGFPAEMCALCGISVYRAKRWCNPNDPQFCEAFAEAFQYALTLSEAFWLNTGRLACVGKIQGFSKDIFRFLVERSFTPSTEKLTEPPEAKDDKQQNRVSNSDSDFDMVVEKPEPADSAEAYRWLLQDIRDGKSPD